MQIKTILKGKTNRRGRKTGIGEVKELTVAKYSVFSNQCESEIGILECDVELVIGNQCRLERGSLKRDVELVIGNQCKSESVRL